MKPNSRLSLQKHNFRCEMWYVLSGDGHAIIGEDTIILGKGTHVYIPTGVKHRLVNTNQENNLVILEIQSGNKIDENDIERFEDDYNRLTNNE